MPIKNSLFKALLMQRSMKWFKNVFIPVKSFVFHTTQRLFLHRWLKPFPWLCYSLVEDGAYSLPCLHFSDKKNTDAKSFIFKPFKLWPDEIDVFKRYIDPEHGVYNKFMFDYDQLKCFE